MTTEISKIQEEVSKELADPKTLQTLVETTFKGLKPETAKKAMIEGMIRGFKFNDFLEKNVYAIPFKENYSLVTSIDYARKLGMRNGVVGVSAPTFTEDTNGKVVTCSITVKRRVKEDIGEFTATVYFDEYYKKPIERNGYTIKSLWDSKPRTMISKVAEMHALRKACPEELSQSYVEEEITKEAEPEVKVIDLMPYKEKMSATRTLAELGVVWSAMPIEAKKELEGLKNELKTKLTPNENTYV